MFLCHYEDRITVVDGKLCRIVNATAKRKGCEHLTLDIYREFEDETADCRNLYYSMVGGYRVAFPGTKNAYGETEPEEDFGKTPLIKIYLTKRANPNKVLKYLYKNTSLQSQKILTIIK